MTGSVMKRVGESGADAIVTKSIGRFPRKGHSGPVLTTSHGGLINAVGLTNPGIEAFEEEIAILRKAGIPVILSVFGSSVDEVVDVAKIGYTFQPDAIELNLSCPHAEIAQIAHSPKLTAEYVSAVKKSVDCQVFAKITPNASDYVSVGKSAEEAGADAIVAINTLRAMKIDIHQQIPVLGNKVGGLSGPPIFPIAVRCVYDLHKDIKIPIIGVGGVTTWEDAIEMHLAGASAIQVGTALLDGMQVFEEIKSGVQSYLSARGYSNTSDIVGLAGRSE